MTRHRTVAASRPLLRALVPTAIGLAGADLLLVMGHWQGLSLPTWFDERHFSVAVSVILLAIVLVLARALDRSESLGRPEQQVLDAIEAGLVLFDAQEMT